MARISIVPEKGTDHYSRAGKVEKKSMLGNRQRARNKSGTRIQRLTGRATERKPANHYWIVFKIVRHGNRKKVGQRRRTGKTLCRKTYMDRPQQGGGQIVSRPIRVGGRAKIKTLEKPGGGKKGKSRSCGQKNEIRA